MTKKYLITAGLAIFLCACGSDVKVKLKSDHIEYQQKDFDVCRIIASVNGKKIHDYNRHDGKIDEDDIHVICPPMQIQTLGKQETVIKVNNNDVSLNFYVEDTTPPKIKVDKAAYQVEEGNEYFDIKKLVTVRDNFDRHPTIGWTGDYDLQKPGEYTVRVSAVDQSKNKASKNIKIIVTKQQVQIIEKPVIINGNNSSAQGSAAPPSGGNTAQSPTLTQPSSLPIQTWLFTDGYDLQSGFQACQNYRGSNAGSCTPLKDSNGWPYGYQYHP